jgi:hypothetical protein
VTAVGVVPALPDLDRAIREVARQLQALAVQCGRGPSAERIQSALARPPGRQTVVVAGQTDTGKSRLINALLGHPGLLPTGDDGGTSSFVVLDHAETPQASVFLTTSQTPLAVDVADVGQWASAGANPGNERGVRWLEVRVDSPLLTQMRIIDTPGAGGLEQGHAALTIEALGQADALLFVLDAGAPISLPELRFLEAAAERVETVVIALARVDMYPGWRTVAADDTASIAAHAPRFAAAPMIAVSSALAERGLGLPSGPDATALRTESGLAAIESVLVERVGRRRGIVPLANLMRACELEKATLEDALLRDIAVTGTDASLRDALEREQTRLRALTSDAASWRESLDLAVRRLTLNRGDELRRRLADIESRFATTVQASHGKQALEALPSQLASEVAAVASRLALDTTAEITAIADRILGDIEATPDMVTAVRSAAAFRLASLDFQHLPPAHATSASDRLGSLMTFYVGHSLVLGIPAAGLLVGAAPLAIVSIGVGAAFSFAMSRGRTDTALRNELRVWTREQIGTAQALLGNDFARHLLDFTEEVRSAMTVRLNARQAEINDSLASLRRAMDDDLTTRRQRAATANNQLASLRAIGARTTALRQRLDGLRPAAMPAPPAMEPPRPDSLGGPQLPPPPPPPPPPRS